LELLYVVEGHDATHLELYSMVVLLQVKHLSGDVELQLVQFKAVHLSQYLELVFANNPLPH